MTKLFGETAPKQKGILDGLASTSRQTLNLIALVCFLFIFVLAAIDIYAKGSIVFPIAIAIGLLSIFSAISNEIRGSYRAKVRIVRKEEQPEKFRQQTIMLLTVGIAILSIGAVSQLVDWWLASTTH